MDAHANLRDVVPGREGHWMQTSLGGQFFPADPRPEEIFISDIANGLALDCRYNGQGRTDRYYSVAEHCVHMARYARQGHGWAVSDPLVLAVLLHDAAEAYLNDVNRAVKMALGYAYTGLENRLQEMILRKYDALHVYLENQRYIKELDRRMIPAEKAALMRHQRDDWAHDVVEPLPGVEIACWTPDWAKTQFLVEWRRCADAMNLPNERIEI